MTGLSFVAVTCLSLVAVAGLSLVAVTGLSLLAVTGWSLVAVTGWSLVAVTGLGKTRLTRETPGTCVTDFFQILYICSSALGQYNMQATSSKLSNFRENRWKTLDGRISINSLQF
ncbi:hypothetical protein AVEN_86982-1 [Araneus ventricosus]|uniref:Uncharacterized protein n=1 Tax=Araneus ventricosus TaxID=182803 RepID=A0A4Y2LCV5_ARAVE|nr:hypothetical protein AVEN_86982-1 [Araneus ventricosus]